MSEEKKRDGAIRLFGALSGVDEKYLAACEQDCGASQNHIGKIRVFAQKHGKAAAVIGIAVLGLGLVYLQSSNQPKSMNQSATPSQMQNGGSYFASDGSSKAYDTADSVAGMAAESAAEPAAAPESTAPDQAEGRTNSQALTKEADDAIADDAALTLEAARETAVVDKYLPAVLPQEGETAWVTTETLKGQERVTICWTYPDGGGSFLWTVKNLGEEEPNWTKELSAEPLLLEGAGLSRADMETQLGDALGSDGWIADGTLYIRYSDAGNDILLEFQGSCDADTLWEMLCSVG